MSTETPRLNAGTGLRRSSSKGPSISVSKKDSVTSRALALSTYFLSGVLSINLSQFIGTPLRLIDEDWYNAWIAFTKQSFGLLTMSLTQAFAPTTVIISGDASVRGQMHKGPDGNLVLDFPERLIMIANHQIYTDWLYLWWIAYCNKMHGYLYIVLKESLKRIPIVGWGMQLSQFIFLKRNWEQDRPQMAHALKRLDKPGDPMWLLLFPEGTNLAPDTRLKSAAWAKKSGITDCRHVLLPRSTGLQFCLEQLKDSVDYLYDCTVAYEGVPRGEYAQDIFTLKAGYLQGRPPKSVSMYWRRFPVKNIPIHNEEAFRLWLIARWREKDLMIENYHRFGRMPSDVGATKTPQGRILRGCGLLNVQIRPSHWYEFLQIFAPMGILAMVLYIFYGALPQSMWKSINDDALQASTNEIQQLKQSATNVQGALGSFDLSSFFDKDKQNETFQRIGIDLMKRLQTPEAKRIVDRASLVQRWLEDPQKFVSDNLEGEAPKKQNFLQALKEEESRRRGQAHGPHQGTFWKDVEELAAIRNTKNETNAKGPVSRLTRHALDASQAYSKSEKAPTQKKHGGGSFWDDLKTEESSRRGSVITVSSSLTTQKHRPMRATSSTDIGRNPHSGPPIRTAPKKISVPAVRARARLASPNSRNGQQDVVKKPKQVTDTSTTKPPLHSATPKKLASSTKPTAGRVVASKSLDSKRKTGINASAPRLV